MIETLDDWNDRLTQCGCCEIRGQDGLTIEAEALIGRIYLLGFVEDYEDIKFYSTRTYTYSTGGQEIYNYPNTFFCIFKDVVIQDDDDFTVTVDGDISGGIISTDFTDELDIESVYLTAKSQVDAVIDWGTMDAEDFVTTSYFEAGNLTLFQFFADLAYTRAKFSKLVTTDFPPGGYLKVTYDLVFYPQEGDPSFLSQDNIVEWEGTYNESDPSDPANFTDYIYIDPPEDFGNVQMKNIRFTRFIETPYGNKPQITGEAFP